MRVLHAGCGTDVLPAVFQDYEEVRLDIDPGVFPHICASMTDMGEIGEFDSIWCSHSLEHLSPQDAKKALREFLRVMKDGAYAIVVVPDTEGIDPNDETVLYECSVGPITGRDLHEGARVLVDQYPYMRHQNAFVSDSLQAMFEEAGFQKITMKRLPIYSLLAVGFK